MAETEVRGSVLLAYLKYIRKKWGDAGMKQLENDLDLYLNTIKGGKWYDWTVSQEILTWIEKTKGREYVFECGKHTVKNLGILSYLVRFMDIKTLLKKGPTNFQQGFKYGKVLVSFHGDNSAHVKFIDATLHEQSCIAWEGALTGIMEMTKTKGTVEKIKCQLKGDRCCEYLLKWE